MHSCVDTMATTAPRHRCYCEMGYMGEGCSKRSALSRKFREGELGEEGGYKSRKLVRGGEKMRYLTFFIKFFFLSKDFDEKHKYFGAGLFNIELSI